MIPSGYAALNYEMAWMRQLVSLFGVTYFAITTILTVFMAGIALGSVLVGRMIDRTSWSPLAVFAALEVFLAVYAQVFPHALGGVEQLYLDLAVGDDTSFFTHAILRFVFGALILLPPTIACGGTLPAASKAFVRADDRIGRDVASLYGANLVGAAAGCLVTTYFTIGLWGYPATAWMGTGANLTAALLALGALWLVRDAAPAPAGSTEHGPGPWRPGAAVVGVGYFAVGFCALGIEILWTRAVSQFGFNPATYVFGLVLVTFLAGHAVGAQGLFPALIRRYPPTRLFGWFIFGFAGMGLLSVLLLIPRPGDMTAVAFLRDIGLVLPVERIWLIFPGVFLPAMFSGALFPLASRLSIRNRGGVGRGVGSLVALSTVGGIAGSLLTGFWLMPALGTMRCLLMFAALAALAGIWSTWALAGMDPVARRRRALPATAVTFVGLIGLLAAVPSHAHLLLFPGEEVKSFSEGRNSSTAVVDHPTAGRFMLTHGERLKGGGSNIILAAAMHPAARRVAVIGLGTGRVAAVALGLGRFERVTAVDINGDLPDIIPLMLGEDHGRFRTDAFRFVENDGRHFLLTGSEQFDIIVNDAALYAWYLELSTLEFNRIAEGRLAPDGLYLGRLHLWRITDDAFRREIATFIEVFPNAALWKLSDDIAMLVGRNGDLPLDSGVVLDMPADERPVLWYDADGLAELAAGERLITDDHPLHVPHTFHSNDQYQIIEYIAPEGEIDSGALSSGSSIRACVQSATTYTTTSGCRAGGNLLQVFGADRDRSHLLSLELPAGPSVRGATVSCEEAKVTWQQGMGLRWAACEGGSGGNVGHEERIVGCEVTWRRLPVSGKNREAIRLTVSGLRGADGTACKPLDWEAVPIGPHRAPRAPSRSR